MRKVKLPKPAKVPRPQIKALRENLKGLITVSLENRIAALALVLQWYDSAVPYVVQKYGVEKEIISILEKAQACRSKGIGTSNLEDKENFFLTAIRLFEKACAKVKPAKVDSYFKAFQEKKETLEQKKSRLELKYGEVMEMLQGIVGNRFRITVADSQNAAQFDPQLRSLAYNRAAIKRLTEKYRKEGLLAVFLDQMDILTQNKAMVEDGTGGLYYDEKRHLLEIQELLKSFLAFSKTDKAPNKLVKRGWVARAPRDSSGERTVSKEKVGGRFGVNSTIGIAYKRLEDEKEHLLSDVLAGLGPVPVRGMKNHGAIRHLVWIGNRDKVWTIKIVGDKIQLLFRQKGVA